MKTLHEHLCSLYFAIKNIIMYPTLLVSFYLKTCALLQIVSYNLSSLLMGFRMPIKDYGKLTLI